ncbi:MAG: hypothetical protein LIP02_03780 [Bacteroidales bacterium]|nr:hypothetical protein [Bacteroidales bacterium]
MSKYKKYLTALAFPTLLAGSLMAQLPVDDDDDDDFDGAIEFPSYVVTAEDSAAYIQQLIQQSQRQHADPSFVPLGSDLKDPGTDSVRPVKPYKFYAIGRSYGDSIVLRFMPDEYAPWKEAAYYGYLILRFDDRGKMDTLARCLKPLSLQEFETRYAPEDTMAGVAANALYSRATAVPELSSVGAIFDKYEEQQTRYSEALIAAEFRADLAQAMGNRFVDRRVLEGKQYSYIIRPLIPDSVMPFEQAQLTVKNNVFHRPAFEPALTDSLDENGCSITLYWPLDEEYSAFDIERRSPGQTWRRLNSVPYMVTTTFEEFPKENHYFDNNLEVGDYEYRLRGYDSFGGISEWSPVYKTRLPDMIGPMPASIWQFEIDRQSEPGKIFADIKWEQDSISPDFIGYNTYYFKEGDKDHWIKLNPEGLIPPTARQYRTEVTDLSTGVVVVAAVDTAGNETGSVPQVLHIHDLVPPVKPSGLRALVSPLGDIVLSWKPNPERDIRGYQLYSANDSTHEFMAVQGTFTRDTVCVDKIQVFGLNQKYIYYKLRAYDLAGNPSEMSDILQVARPSLDKPQMCVSHSWEESDSGITLRWLTQADHTVAKYRLMRRLDSEREWTLAQEYPGEAAQDDGLLITFDNPPCNRQEKYNYAIEAVNAIGLSSDRSYTVSLRHRGPDLVDVPINLKGRFDTDLRRAVLEWALPGGAPSGYSWLVYFQPEGGDMALLRSFSNEQTGCVLNVLSPGKTGIFQVMLQWDDGRYSPMSAFVELERPEEKFDDQQNDQ